MKNPVVPGVILRHNRDRVGRAATFNPRQPIVMVTAVLPEGRFKGVQITGVHAGQMYDGDLTDFRRVPDEAVIQVKQFSNDKRPGDLVANEAGAHVIVSSVDTIPASKLFAGTVIAAAGDTYLHQFSQHWHDDDFHIVRRREELEREGRGKSTADRFRAVVTRARSGQNS